MAYSLSPHPDQLPWKVRGVGVTLERDGTALRLRYEVDGADHVIWPAPASPARADELWRTTCFELFLRFDDDERYVEFDFSPSTRWAAYVFEGYRDGITALRCDPAPMIKRLYEGVAVALDLRGLPHGELAMGLTAVIEEEGGVKSFWSLAHPPGAPDFHHPACFVARLPSPATL